MGCGGALDSRPAEASRPCARPFDPEFDYFPHRAEIRHASGFGITYGRHWKRIEVDDPAAGEASLKHYLLVVCGGPPPALRGAQLVELPIARVVTTSTTELPHLVELGLVERLVGHDELDWVTSAAVLQRAESGELVEIGSGARLDVERLLALAPDLLLTQSAGGIRNTDLSRLRDAGIAVVLVPSYLETSPLGRAEWIKLTAAFFDLEERAEEVFGPIEKRYLELAQKVAELAHRPTVLTGAALGSTWYVPGGRSFMARLLNDAGASYPWRNDLSSGSLALDLESVVARAAAAEIWLHPSDYPSLQALRVADQRYAAFAAFATGQVWGNDARRGPHGGNAYWEAGSLRPDWVLADLVAILHPELLAEHQMVFHRRLKVGDG